MEETKRDIKERSFEFSVRIIKFIQKSNKIINMC